VVGPRIGLHKSQEDSWTASVSRFVEYQHCRHLSSPYSAVHYFSRSHVSCVPCGMVKRAPAPAVIVNECKSEDVVCWLHILFLFREFGIKWRVEFREFVCCRVR